MRRATSYCIIETQQISSNEWRKWWLSNDRRKCGPKSLSPCQRCSPRLTISPAASTARTAHVKKHFLCPLPASGCSCYTAGVWWAHCFVSLLNVWGRVSTRALQVRVSGGFPWSVRSQENDLTPWKRITDESKVVTRWPGSLCAESLGLAKTFHSSVTVLSPQEPCCPMWQPREHVTITFQSIKIK